MANPQKENGYTPIANELLEALAKTNINGEAWRVLLSIMRRTYGYHKKEDRISVSQIQAITGMRRQNIFRALKALKTANIINGLKSETNKREVATYSVQKDHERWGKVINIVSNRRLVSDRVSASLNPLCSGGLQSETHKRKKKFKENARARAKYLSLTNINNLRELFDTDQSVKNHLLGLNYTEHEIDEALGRKY